MNDLRADLHASRPRLLNQEKVVDIKDIKAIIDLMKKNQIAEFELEKDGFKLRLKRGLNGSQASTLLEELPAPAHASSSLSLSLPQSSGMSLAAPAAIQDLEIKAPMVGTFYRAPSPEAASYVEIGSELNPETVVCIIEAMKVMNEIKAELRGVVTQVLVENGKPVEFGQPLFKIRPL
ncbi:MAG: acetyl-CoA carboxylase biotin carboxyl carrier protein [Candidatus Omnitrophica bacterium]|nr:acetyl-CoA carboxylase biotin carboxyl carrier protein [Candidatus Omnitrophota bacterium]